MMCDEHRSQKCILRKRKRLGCDEKQDVCLEDEDQASRCSKILIIVPLICSLIAVSILAILFTTKDEPDTD